MGVEAAMGQADLFHDVGDARAVVPAAPNGARGGPDDPFVGDFLAAWCGPSGGDSAHMMIIIYQSDAQRKGRQGAKRTERYAIALADVQGSRVCEFRCDSATIPGRSSGSESQHRCPEHPVIATLCRDSPDKSTPWCSGGRGFKSGARCARALPVKSRRRASSRRMVAQILEAPRQIAD